MCTDRHGAKEVFSVTCLRLGNKPRESSPLSILTTSSVAVAGLDIGLLPPCCGEVVGLGTGDWGPSVFKSGCRRLGTLATRICGQWVEKPDPGEIDKQVPLSGWRLRQEGRPGRRSRTQVQPLTAYSA